MRALPGPRNLITDVPGLMVGNAHDAAVRTGATVLLGDAPFVAGVHVMGGAPGSRETDLLAADKTVSEVDALVLSGARPLVLMRLRAWRMRCVLRGAALPWATRGCPSCPARSSSTC